MRGQQYVAEWALWSTTARVVVRRPQDLAPARAAAEQVLAEVDAAANRFDASSEVSRLAREGADRTEVSAALGDLLAAALRVARLTDGCVDPTVGRAMVALGYDRAVSGGQVVVPLTLSAPASWHDIHLEGGRLTLPAGVLLDLGATGKAHAVDRAAERAWATTGAPVLVSIGGDLRALGPEDAPGWSVEVAEHPEGPGVAWVDVSSGGVATSTTTARTWTGPNGSRMHHVLDPSTGRPAAVHWRTATVAAATCVDANAASTAVLVKGSAAERWLRGWGLPARLTHRDGSVLAVGGWPERDAA